MGLLFSPSQELTLQGPESPRCQSRGQMEGWSHHCELWF